MAMDYARYMVMYPDVYDMFRKPGSGRPNWTWDNGRKAGQYQRNDGSMTQQETAAQYAQAHYNNFGKREGRKMHERKDDTYEKLISAVDAGGSSGSKSSGSSGGGSQSGQMNAQLAAMIKSLAELNTGLNEENITPEQAAENAQQTNTVLTNYLDTESKKKKKSFLQSIGD